VTSSDSDLFHVYISDGESIVYIGPPPTAAAAATAAAVYITSDSLFN